VLKAEKVEKVFLELKKMRKCAKIREYVQKYEKVCKNMRNCAKI
jgi:hypothetical protein